jgi:hypothetical protein
MRREITAAVSQRRVGRVQSVLRPAAGLHAFNCDPAPGYFQTGEVATFLHVLLGSAMEHAALRHDVVRVKTRLLMVIERRAAGRMAFGKGNRNTRRKPP